MNITKFSLPEGCDLRLEVNGVAASVLVMYKGEQIAVICRTMMGLGLSVRRSVLGVNYVYGDAEVGWGGLRGYPTRDIRQAIRTAVDRFRSASEILADNFRHFENLSMSAETIDRMREIAQVSYRATRDRMGVAASSMSFRVGTEVDTFVLPDVDVRRQYYTRSQLDPMRPRAFETIPVNIDTNAE